jgi:hypothetical protein
VGTLKYLDELFGKQTEEFEKFLLGTDRRRGFINAGGAALKWLFGSATMTDLDELNSTVDALHKKEEAIAHSLFQQVL